MEAMGLWWTAGAGRSQTGTHQSSQASPTVAMMFMIPRLQLKERVVYSAVFGAVFHPQGTAQSWQSSLGWRWSSEEFQTVSCSPTNYSRIFTFCVFGPEHCWIKRRWFLKTHVHQTKNAPSCFPESVQQGSSYDFLQSIVGWGNRQKMPQKGLLIDHFALWKTGFLFSFLRMLGLDKMCACVCTCDISSGVIIMFSSPVFPRFLLPRRLARWQQMELLFTFCAYDPTEIRQEMNVELALSVGRLECLGSRHSRAGEAPEMAQRLPVSWQMLILH